MDLLSSRETYSAFSTNQNYFEILEKTNQQLGLWTNPYGLMVGALSVLVALVAIGTAVIIYKQSSDHKREMDKAKKEFMDKLSEETANKLALVQEQSKLVDGGAVLEDLPKGTVIRAIGLDFLYWFGSDGQRYTFPTEDIFHSWFPSTNFSPLILRLKNEKIASIPLAGNITYRASTRLIKIASDPKIYAIGRGGMIHWIQSVQLIQEIFGLNWQNNLVIIPDALFVDYTVGHSLESAQSYSMQLEFVSDKLP